MVVIALLIVLAACGTSEPSSDVSGAQSQNNSEVNTNLDAKESPTTSKEEDEVENSSSESGGVSSGGSSKEETSDSMTQESLKEEFLIKLEATKKEAEGLEAKDSSTYALKEEDNSRWKKWDDLLNEIYGVLEEQLSSEEMNQLREEQRNWIEVRDERALEASEEYKGGTQEHLEYVSVLANVTKERCYELVEKYMN
ncbi:lysozyme inhibitor LprI family protein [Alkalibacillus salilacus]|uniref:Uncharacterized protein YecT (DUF1311 family) n=1 Tax=Alkalibacillus salilacus TaxID=284582 RepID=A0ABT9VHC1_9BACI|nr:lysozyme inhibitor LprI family protein [Alkalibacillus salilacus]MDQ0160362.1 uncharacterized protein YecT (DUF1311 family) [Alkalibacillus salilacus]